ncbi:hypothetical protein BpHYR1_020024 [Brachionus plicatilis]|uniref:Uncharacterized protein n=1 Tax=Brachionus plicatilis TaxID=10195 RepID=A0A3M7P5E6_BRAPC|nr:hypothetical protein BpHYR1_020024 [Brachionus plicatilis]
MLVPLPLHASRLLISRFIFHNSTFWSSESSKSAALIFHSLVGYEIWRSGVHLHVKSEYYNH